MKFKLTVDFLKLQVGEANKVPKFDMVHVIRLPSFEGWLRTKVIGRWCPLCLALRVLRSMLMRNPWNPNTLTITASVYGRSNA